MLPRHHTIDVDRPPAETTWRQIGLGLVRAGAAIVGFGAIMYVYLRWG